MKLACVRVFLACVLLASEILCLWSSSVEEPLPDVFELDTEFGNEPSDEDYTDFVPFSYGGIGDVNPEENEVDAGENEPKPDLDIAPSEDEQPENTDFGPLPDPETNSLDNLAEKVEKLLSDFKRQQDKVAELEEANRRLIMKIDSIEQTVKTNSIILTNVRQDRQHETSKMTLQRVLHVFNRIMRVRVTPNDIAVALRAQDNSSAIRNKPIVVRFTNFATKMKVLGASNRLSPTNISVSSDYSELVAHKRAALVPYLQKSRAEGHRSYILYDKLMEDGVLLTLEELRAREEAEKENREVEEQVEMLDVDPLTK